MFKPSAGFALISLITLLLLLPFSGAAASSPAGDAGFDIPLSDLRKVEKKTRKPARKGRREKAKAVAKGQEASAPKEAEAAAVPKVREGQPPAMPEQQPKTVAPAAGASPGEESARIIHDPNSYVVIGKRTVVKAVISSLEALQSARCQFRSAENDGYAFVPMTKEDGSRYTYSATLPQLVEGASTLRYRFVAVDTRGRVTRSREFVVPVVQSSVMPGWQREPSGEAILIRLEDPSNPNGGR